MKKTVVKQHKRNGKVVKQHTRVNNKTVTTQKKIIKKSKPKYDIYNETPLLPEIIAESVAGDHLAKGNITPDEFQPLVDHLVERTNRHYGTNEQFRKTMKSSGGRDSLYAFHNHWTQAKTGKRK